MFSLAYPFVYGWGLWHALAADVLKVDSNGISSFSGLILYSKTNYLKTMSWSAELNARNPHNSRLHKFMMHQLAVT